MIAIVNEMQVCGGKICPTLLEACQEYLKCVAEGGAPEKIHFSISLPNGDVRHITIRQEDNQVVAYGDFVGLPSFLEYAKEIY